MTENRLTQSNYKKAIYFNQFCFPHGLHWAACQALLTLTFLFWRQHAAKMQITRINDLFFHQVSDDGKIASKLSENKVISLKDIHKRSQGVVISPPPPWFHTKKSTHLVARRGVWEGNEAPIAAAALFLSWFRLVVFLFSIRFTTVSHVFVASLHTSSYLSQSSLYMRPLIFEPPSGQS